MSCDCWFQDPLPEKVYEADHEKTEEGDFAGHLMSDHDKMVNMQLAGSLAHRLEPNSKVLDIGSKYPYLAHCFREFGHQSFGIDGIDIVPQYSEELGVPMICADFETLTPKKMIMEFGVDRFDLITMVHVFEHMYDPLKTLRVLRSLVKDDGRVFLRMPDHRVDGFERDLTTGHFTIHPFFHSMGSILELLVQGKNLFTVETYRPMAGAGQSDYVLKPLTRKPTIYAGLIVKNEEKHLPICLKSIEDIVDGVVIIDTGSTDNTEFVAHNTIKKNVDFSVYTDASEKDEHGDWKIWDFSKARNQFVSKIDNNENADYCLWMDADDTLMTPYNLRRAVYLDEYEIFGVRMSAGQGNTWIHHRLWKTRHGIAFRGAIHEYPTLETKMGIHLEDSLIVHDAAPTASESSLERNLRILKREFEEDQNNSRTCFYLANTYVDQKDYKNGVAYYQRRIALGEHYRDEFLFAHLYMARCYRNLNENDNAIKTLRAAIAVEPDWAEFWAELAIIFFNEKQWWASIGHAILALTKKPTKTQLWRENDKYTDQPCRLLSWAYQELHSRKDSLMWARKAKTLITTEDADWDGRIQSLERKQVAFVRPGAIGDIIMTMHLIQEYQRKNPNTEVHYFCNVGLGNQLREFMEGCGVVTVRDVSTIEAAKGWFDEVVNLVGYPLAEGYPLVPMSRHLIRSFGQEMGLDLPINEELPSALLPLPETRQVEGRYATIHPKAGWSMYKNWPIERWAEVLKTLNMPVYQIGAKDDPKVPGANHDFLGKPLDVAINLLAFATIHMGVDSFSNHVTNVEWFNADTGFARKTPAVILWGSTQYTASGYAHNKNISLGLECQPCFKEDPKISQMSMGICENPPNQTYTNPQHACMMGIAVETVVKAVHDLLEEETENESQYWTVPNVVGAVSNS
jgi:ADP-heptose:LPS heptosyltransferase/glycosyltransferase involved in cell wall biosynthesis/2-polyprenyl-3-methyl-5-hydroxy-6-metoxy-1,4-benzoquinol methylase